LRENKDYWNFLCPKGYFDGKQVNRKMLLPMIEESTVEAQRHIA